MVGISPADSSRCLKWTTRQPAKWCIWEISVFLIRWGTAVGDYPGDNRRLRSQLRRKRARSVPNLMAGLVA